MIGEGHNHKPQSGHITSQKENTKPAGTHTTQGKLIPDSPAQSGLKGKRLANRTTTLSSGKTSDIRWALKIIKTSNIDRKDCSGLCIPLHIPPEKIGRYVVLQEIIAKMIPQESLRPTLDVLISRPDTEPSIRLGIVGGVGPVSDANITEKMIRIAQERGDNLDNVQIHLFSSPPPRSIIEKASRGLTYLNNLASFTKKDHDFLVLASNTAHCNLTHFGHGGRMPTSAEVINSVRHIVVDMHKEEPGTVMVLGTTEAYKKNLYPGILNENNIPSAKPSETLQRQIQSLINRVKSADADRKTLSREIATLITRFYQQCEHGEPRPTHLILGCTELPLGLGEEMMKDLETKLGIRIVDTEKALARTFSLFLRENPWD